MPRLENDRILLVQILILPESGSEFRSILKDLEKGLCVYIYYLTLFFYRKQRTNIFYCSGTEYWVLGTEYCKLTGTVFTNDLSQI